MKKNIGCVLAYCDNFGTMLQSYATIKIIQELGLNCDIIRYKKQQSFFEKLMVFFNLLRIGDISDQKRKLFRIINRYRYKDYCKNMLIRHQAYDRFGGKYLKPFFKEYVGYNSLKDGAYNYDVVLVGSDQLWTPMSLYSKFYNLLFVDENIPKVAYATSFGVSKIPDFQKRQTGDYLNRFKIIGVREQSGKDIVESLSNQKAEVVADPTMLLTREEWDTFASESNTSISESYILCYYLGRNMEARRAAKELKEKSGYKIVALCHNDEYIHEDDFLGDETLYDIDPCDFISLIKNAAYICTDSFHCSVFSILFHKKFMSFYRYAQTNKGSRNTRIDNLLNKFNLNERLYKGRIDVISNEIPYNLVEKQVQDFRYSSLLFLQNSLSL